MIKLIGLWMLILVVGLFTFIVLSLPIPTAAAGGINFLVGIIIGYIAMSIAVKVAEHKEWIDW